MIDENFTWYHDDVDHVPMHPHNDWIVDRCADHCDDQLPLFSRVGRGLQGNGYIVEKVIDNESQTILVGSIIDPRTGEKTEQWRTGNINGGRLHYTKNINPATNPQTFTLTFTLDRPDDPNRGWTFTTPAIPYVWTDEPNTYVSSLFVKAVGDPDWTEIPEALMTPHSIDESLAKIEKLIYPEAILDRDELHAPQPGDPNTVNLTYGLGGDINVPNLNNLARILGVNPNSLKALANNGEDATRYPSFGTGRNAKEYIDWHLHQDLGGGDGLPDVPSKLNLTPLKGDGGSKTVWDWIQYAIDQAKEHLHKDLGGGIGLPDVSESSLKPLKGDGGSKTVWDWIMWLKGLIDNITVDVENPKLYKVSLTVDLVTLNIRDTTLTKNTRLIASHLSNGSIPSNLVGDVIGATLEISYFDVLPMITIDVKIDAGDHTGLDVGNLLVVCTNGTYTPINLSTIQLPNRKSMSKNLKAALLNPENLSNTGNQVTWDGSNVVNGTWALYTGVGDPYTRSGETSTRDGGSPWEYGGNPYFYIMNRATGVGELAPRVDNARIYSCSYNMATLGPTQS